MKRPKQLPTVDRNASKIAVVPIGANARPSGYFDEIFCLFFVNVPVFQQLVSP